MILMYSTCSQLLLFAVNCIIQAYSSFTSNMSQRSHFMAFLRILAASCTLCHNVRADDFSECGSPTYNVTSCHSYRQSHTDFPYIYINVKDKCS